MVADYNVQLLLGVMECTTEVNADMVFHQRLHLSLQHLCSQLLLGLSVLHCASVSVLMFIMPPVKIYIKSYNAARSHASNQSSEKDTKDADVNSLLLSRAMVFHRQKKAKRTRQFLQHCLKFLSLAENQKCISNFCNWF